MRSKSSVKSTKLSINSINTQVLGTYSIMMGSPRSSLAMRKSIRGVVRQERSKTILGKTGGIPRNVVGGVKLQMRCASTNSETGGQCQTGSTFDHQP